MLFHPLMYDVGYVVVKFWVPRNIDGYIVFLFAFKEICEGCILFMLLLVLDLDG